MPLLIRPVKMNKSIYVRVPNDIAHIIGLDNRVEVSFSFEDNETQLRLIYSLNKSGPETVNDPSADGRSVVDTGASSHEPRSHERKNENGTKAETQGLPAG